MPSVLNLRRLASSVSVVALTFGLAFGQQSNQKAVAQVAFHGSGATSIQPLVDNWFTSLGISYNAIGSGAGRADFEAGTTDFVSTDLTLPSVDGQVVINAVNIPVSFVYNPPDGFTGSLSLSTAQVCGIISGTINNFNQLDSSYPDQAITFVYRSDSSGTTSILNTFTTANCTDSSGNPLSVPPFPVGTGVSGSSGIISTVSGTVGAIGYVDTPAAQAAGVQIATLDTTISGPNYVVFRSSYSSADQAAVAQSLCQYITGDGRSFALTLGYGAGATTSDACNAIQGGS